MLHIRERIAEKCAIESPLSGEVEVDESFFGAGRVKGKRGRGAGGKTIVFGLLKRNGKVYTKIVPNCSRATLQAVIRGKVDIGSTIHSDGHSGYDGLMDLNYKNTIGFNMAEVNLPTAGPISTESKTSGGSLICDWPSYLHLKECELRFNHRGENLYNDY